MVDFTMFNIVLLGALQVGSVDVSDFDFHGQRAVESVRVPPVLQAVAGDYTIDILPGRFQVSANSAKATQHRVEPMKAAVVKFADEYVGRRSITAVGFNFLGNVAVREGAVAKLASVVDVDRLQSVVGQAISPRLSVTLSWDVPDLARCTLKFEPLQNDDSRLYFEANFHIGEAPVGVVVPSTPLEVTVTEAVDRFEAARILLNSAVDSFIAGGD